MFKINNKGTRWMVNEDTGISITKFWCLHCVSFVESEQINIQWVVLSTIAMEVNTTHRSKTNRKRLNILPQEYLCIYWSDVCIIFVLSLRGVIALYNVNGVISTASFIKLFHSDWTFNLWCNHLQDY